MAALFIYIRHVNMRRKKPIQVYNREVNELKNQGREWGLSEEEINFAFGESLLYLRDKFPALYNKYTEDCASRSSRHYFRFFTFFVILVVGICYGLSFHKPTHNFVERNIQEAIYPFMKWYRRVTLPMVEWFPSLTELYDESCLVENPYFQVSDMDCWPCENVRFVLNLTDSNFNYHEGLPYIVKIPEPEVTFSDLQEEYDSNRELFDTHASKIKSNRDWDLISDLFANDPDFLTNDLDVHVIWRINRMEPGRALRSLLKPPRKVPTYATSIGIERYILIDGATSPPYSLPATEGSNVFLKQLTGRRLIILEPTTECLHSCHRLSILLEKQHILWYNWWYWRPKSLPIANLTEESIALLGSTA